MIESEKSSPDQQPEKPLFSVLKGNPSDEEIGVLTAIFEVAKANAANAQADSGIRDNWGAIEETHRQMVGFNPRAFLNARYY